MKTRAARIAAEARLWPYWCTHCRRIVRRESTKQWIKSWCDRTGRYVRLQRVRP